MKILEVLLDIEQIIFFITTFFCIYQVVIVFFTLSKEPKKEKVVDKKHKFMAVISARNEENVIANLIESLKKQDYPEELLDIYVIADNCTDNTAKVAKDAGAIVLERYSETKKSKGYALEWFFDYILANKPDEYDAFCVFDADNIVSKNFYSKMNEKLCLGEKIVQGYRDIKNASDTWVTGNYAIFYWMMNRFYHYTRYKIGLSPLINGTGFMVAMSIVKENNGWHTKTLTEDIEFSINSIAAGHTIGWAKDAVVYDEQPLGFEQSWRQRMRWSVGHVQCLKHCMPKLITAKNFNASTIDAIIYLLGMPILWISLLLFAVSLVKFIFLPMNILGYVSRIAFGFILAMLQALAVVIIEKKGVKKMVKGIVMYPVFLISWFFINILAIFNTKLEWKQISHVRSVDIKEIN